MWNVMRVVWIGCGAALLSACSEIPPEAYYKRGEAESLLDISSEAVTISLRTPEGVYQTVEWLNSEQPKRADLACTTLSPHCNQAERALRQFGVPVYYTSSAEEAVTLHYERVLVRDCENRYIDNTINNYNLHHPTYGCSMAANMVQMVSNKEQFVNPSLLGFGDGDKAEQVYQDYLIPPSEKDDTGSVLDSLN